MNILLKRIKNNVGKKNEWIAQSDTCENIGIGHTRADAIDSLIRSNLEIFGIKSWTDIDELSQTPKTVWKYTP